MLDQYTSLVSSNCLLYCIAGSHSFFNSSHRASALRSRQQLLGHNLSPLDLLLTFEGKKLNRKTQPDAKSSVADLRLGRVGSYRVSPFLRKSCNRRQICCEANEAQLPGNFLRGGPCQALGSPLAMSSQKHCFF